MSAARLHAANEDLAPSAAEALAAIEAGHPFTLLLDDNEHARAAALAAVLDGVERGSTRIVRATNPLRAPLTLERLMIQAIDGFSEHAPADNATLMRRIARSRDRERRVILVIERAETLHPEVLHALAETSGEFAASEPALQVLFCGQTRFQRLFEDPHDSPEGPIFEAVRQPDPYLEVPAPELMFQTLPQGPIHPGKPPAPDGSLRAELGSHWGKGWFTRLGIIFGVIGGAAAIGFVVFLVTSGRVPLALPLKLPPLGIVPEPVAPQADPPAIQPGPPASPEAAAMRAEFQAYLAATGRDLRDITQAQRRTIFEEFLTWRARTGALAPP